MKILIVRNFPSYLSVKNNTYNIQEVGLAKALVRKGNVCDIVLWTDREEEDVKIPVDDVGKVHVFYRRGKTLLKNTVYTGCDELFEQYDIIQPAEYNQIQAWLLSKNQPEKTVIYHGPYYSPFNKRYNLMCKAFDAVFLKRYIRQDTKFLVKSEMAKDFLTGKGIHEDNVCVTGVGIDVQMLSASQEDCNEPLYRAMKENPVDLKLLYIGRFEKRRNISFLLEVFQKVLEKSRNAKLYLIGTGDQEYLNDMTAYMEKLGIREQIVWQEKMEQKYLSSIYQQADFFLLPTEYEIFGMVLLEAMYYGNVVLTTKNGGSSTLICSGENGFILENKTPKQWADCILTTHENTVWKESIGQKASKTVEKRYTWDAIAHIFIEQYQRRRRLSFIKTD